MRRELEQKLVERWPSWFNVTGNQRETRMVDGLCPGGRLVVRQRLIYDAAGTDYA
jgi:hypothetical protein